MRYVDEFIGILILFLFPFMTFFFKILLFYIIIFKNVIFL